MFNLSSDAFLSAVGSSGWLKHVKSVLEAAAFVAKAVQDGTSVVVHCSDGWDRTAQTCSLAALLLDPYYRTLDGFQVLIEKEWLSFGHKFTERCGHIQTGDTKEQSPVFTQFVDCIWQVVQQFPSEFEFNEKFLLMLHDHVYSCQFGNFIGNSERERRDLKVKEKTYSLWSYMDSRKDTLTNPLYHVKRRSVLGGNDNLREQVLTLNTSPQVIKFWRNFYNRFESGIHPKESIDDLMVVTYNHILSLERHIRFLESKLTRQQQQQLHQVKLEEKDFLQIETTSGSTKLSSSSKGSSSFDSIDYPLKIVKQCMQRLETKQRQDEAADAENEETASSSGQTVIADETDLAAANRIAREKLRLDDLKIAYPTEARTNQCNTSSTTIRAQVKRPSIELDADQLRREVDSVAVEWQSLRHATECPCGYPFDQTSVRSHCYSCGHLFCGRCIDRKIALPGHVIEAESANSSASSEVFESPDTNSSDLVSVCRSCYRQLTGHDSLTSPA
jgi:myotubularin-related protein 6/7/8